MDYLFALQTIRENVPGFVNYFFVFISEYLVLLAFVFPSIIYWNVNKSAGATILLGYCVSYNINQTIKNFACVYRPWIKDSRLCIEPHAAKSATGYSFPSGHTTTAASIYGGISIWQKNRKGIIALMCCLTVLTAFARNWLGAHTFQDVCCAVLFVAVSLSLVSLIKSWLEKNPALDTIICFAGILLALIILIIVSAKNYPVDYGTDGTLLVDPYKMLTDCYSAFGCISGGLLGWWLERHFLKFSNDVSKKAKWVRGVSGFITTIICYFVMSKVFAFTGDHISHLIKYFLIFLNIFFMHPALFTKVFERKGI